MSMSMTGRQWRVLGWGALALLMALPWVAMRFTAEVRWTGFDFLVFAGLLATLGGGMELAVRFSRGRRSYCIGAAIALLAGVLLVWVNGAVGIIGAEDHPANLMFAGVLGVALVGALLARLRPAGLARAMVATAAAQAGVELVCLAAELPHPPLAMFFFVAMWLLSAGFFRESARR